MLTSLPWVERCHAGLTIGREKCCEHEKVCDYVTEIRGAGEQHGNTRLVHYYLWK